MLPGGATAPALGCYGLGARRGAGVCFGVDRVGAQATAVASGSSAAAESPSLRRYQWRIRPPRSPHSSSSGYGRRRPSPGAPGPRSASPPGGEGGRALPRAAGYSVHIVVRPRLVVDAGAPRGADIAPAGVAGFGAVVVFAARLLPRDEEGKSYERAWSFVVWKFRLSLATSLGLCSGSGSGGYLLVSYWRWLGVEGFCFFERGRAAPTRLNG